MSSASLRTQTRPAIEYVSGEEGLRPKSYFFVISFLEYVFTDFQKYEEAPDPQCMWGRGEMAMAIFRRPGFPLAGRTSNSSFLLSARRGELRA